MFHFHLRGESRRGDGGDLLRAQVLRGVRDDKGLCPLGSRGEGSFVTVKLNPPPFLSGVPFSRYPGLQKINKKKGLGTKNKKQPMSDYDIKQLMEYFRVSIIADLNPKTLQDVVIFNILYYMC